MVVAVGSAFLGLSCGNPAQAGEITVVSWGGAYSASQRKAFYEPFMEDTGQVVLEDEWEGDIERIRTWVETGSYRAHTIDAPSQQLLAGCDEGIWEPIDYGKLGLSPDDFLPDAAHECGVGNVSWSTVYAYRTDVFPEDGPVNWADFWNVDKFPGKRGVSKSPTFNLEFALIADGVPVTNVSSILNSKAGVERAFEKFEELKPHITWWETGTEAIQLLTDKEVAMSTGWNGGFYSAIVREGQPFGIVWDGQGMDYDYWVVPKDHPEADLAYEFIAFASKPERLAEQVRYIPYGPLLREAYNYIGPDHPDILPFLPTSPQNVTKGFKRDTAFWANQYETLFTRFQGLIQ